MGWATDPEEEGGKVRWREHLSPAMGQVLILIKFVCFCGKCCVRIDKCVFFVVKIKYVNSNRLVIFVIKLTLLQTIHILQYLTYILLKHTQHFFKTHKYYNFFTPFKVLFFLSFSLSLYIYFLISEYEGGSLSWIFRFLQTS